ncbi:hypothetical protein BDR04DRAFT_502596 [Suillus decipiens]|nr:hypothetical protein BDR04DRAFT_502596 [Suillus decipiens]
MERLQGQLERKQTNIFLDNSHRMTERPLFIHSGKGRGHEDLGSSFAPSQPVQGKATGSKAKPAASRPIITSLEQNSFSDSDDELLLSEGAQPLDLSPISKRAVRGKTTTSMPQEANLAPNGHPYHPNFPPPKKKLPNFKKIKKQSQVEDWPPSSSLPDADDSQELCRPISDDLAFQTKQFQPEIKPKKEKDTAFARPGPGRDSVSRSRKTVTSSLTPRDEFLKYPNRIPKLRTEKARGSKFHGRSPETTSRGSRPFPLGNHSSIYDGSLRTFDASPPRMSSRESSTAKKENPNTLSHKPDVPFFMSQPKEKASELPHKPVLLPQPKEKTNALSRKPAAPLFTNPLGKPNLSKQPLPQPTGSSPFPLSSHIPGRGLTRSETVGNFPAPSPLASPVQRDNRKSRALTPHQDDGGLAINHCDTVGTNVTLRPFPMGASEIKTARQCSPQSSSESVRSKRASDGGDGECGREAKKHKEDNSR